MTSSRWSLNLPRDERRSSALVGVVLTLTVWAGNTSATAQQTHSAKQVFADQESWPATSPGDVTLREFEPFRAVYDRKYTQASGPGRGEERRDRVIVSAEEVAWNGERAIAIMMLDSGAAEHSDTNVRGLITVVALRDLTVRFELGPVPGRAKDYYLGLVTENEVLLSQVETESQTIRPQKLPKSADGFGPGAWVMAAMDLEKDQKIRLAPYYSPQANPISQSSYGRVVGRRVMTDGSGAPHEAWVVETPGWYGPSSPKVLRLYLKKSPPYYLGTETFNYDTEETSRFVWLRSSRLSGE